MSRSGNTVIVLSSHGIVRWAPPVYSCTSGTRAICSGMASSDTVAMNSTSRPAEVDPGERVGGERGDPDRDDRRRKGDGQRVRQPVAHTAGQPRIEHLAVVLEGEAVQVAEEDGPPPAGRLLCRSRNELTSRPIVGVTHTTDEQPQHPRRDRAQEAVHRPPERDGSTIVVVIATQPSPSASCGGCRTSPAGRR